MSSFFNKSLQDVVKGIRQNKRDPKRFISTVIAECKKELREADPFVKAEAIRKLTYLLMMGYDMSWADFHVVEVMSQARFAHKRIGYLAASQSFQRDTEVVLLTTNLLKKEFSSMNPYDVGQATNCMMNIVNKDLARDLLPDTVTLMSHSKPYVRKKAVLAMYKLFVAYPQGLRLTFEKLKDKLNDPDPAVVSCAVNVICELANKNPKNYLSLAPQFFRLLTTSSNNWMLIKVVKLLGSLVPEEPRLARKLLEPLATIIQNTAAKSLQYECIHTVTLSLPYTKREDGSDSKNAAGVVKLCATMLKELVEDNDQNLKYLGLVGFVQLMRSHPKAVVEHRDLVLKCLSDADETIRLRSLELLTGMVTKRNLEELIHKLLRYVAVSEGSYRDELISKIIYMCSRDKFAYLSDFGWYLMVLVEMSMVPGTSHGTLMARQLMDVSVRVASVRPFAVESMIGMLLDRRLVNGPGQKTIFEVLYAAAWIVGEYANIIPSVAATAWKRAKDAGVSCEPITDTTQNLDNTEDDLVNARGPQAGGSRASLRFPRRYPFLVILRALLNPKITNLPPNIQGVFIQNALKIIVAAVQPGVCEDAELSRIIVICSKRLPIFRRSYLVEVQERAHSCASTLKALGMLVESLEEIPKKDEKSKSDADADIGSSMPDMPEPTEEGGGGLAMGDLLGGDMGLATPEPTPAANSVASLLSDEPDLMDMSQPVDTESPANKLAILAAVDSAKRYSSVLATLLKEAIDPVNPKAQKRVPQPLDLSQPLNPLTLESCYTEEEGDIKPGADVANVSFTELKFYSDEKGVMGGFGSDDYMPGHEHGIGGMGSPASWLGFGGKKEGDDKPPAEVAGLVTGSNHGTYNIAGSPDSDPFYIKKTSSGDGGFGVGDGDDMNDIPIFDLRSEDLNGKKIKKGKKGKKAKKSAKTEYMVNKEDAMPAAWGGHGSDSDDDYQARGKKRGDSDDLSNVDLSTPLGRDEIMPERQHRVVDPNATPPPAPAPVPQATSTSSNKEEKSSKKSSKKDKKEKKKSSSSKKEASSSSGNGFDLMGGGEADLLGGMGLSTPQASQPVDALTAAAPSQPVKEKKEKKDKKEKKKKDSKKEKVDTSADLLGF